MSSLKAEEAKPPAKGIPDSPPEIMRLIAAPLSLGLIVPFLPILPILAGGLLLVNAPLGISPWPCFFGVAV
jgi:hypothetical protein